VAFSAPESRVLDHIVRDFRELYGDDGTYDCSRDVQFRPRVGPKSFVRVRCSSEARMNEFREEFARRLNVLRSASQRIVVVNESMLPKRVLNNRLFAGAMLFVVRPAKEPASGNVNDKRRYWAMHRIFKVTPEGLIFVPFIASDLA